jgi:serine/threonine protein kinase
LIELKDNKDNKYNELINLVENNHLQLEFSNKNNEEKINLESDLDLVSDLVSDSDSDYEFGQLINLSVDVGTGIYKAKEIDTGHYSNSVDIYSLGVLLIEFLIEFKTIHEKIIKLKDINNAISTSKPIPHLITNKYDNLIITMTNDNPVVRPNTKSILTFL